MAPFPPLLFILGKGGVGKTTVAGAWAMARARSERVALVEVNAQQLSSVLARNVNYQGTAITPNLTAFTITPHEAFAEYASHRLGSHTLYRTMFDNRFVHYFLDAIPGVNELMCLGKIWQMVESGQWDRIIVDLPATGHGLGFLQVPRIVTHTVSRGPLHAQGTRIATMLRDPNQTHVWIATLCEELPVNESFDIAARLDTLQMTLAGVIANRMPKAPWPPDTLDTLATARQEFGEDATWQGLFAMADFFSARWRDAATQHQRLVDAFGAKLHSLPEVASSSPEERMATLATQMTGWSA